MQRTVRLAEEPRPTRSGRSSWPRRFIQRERTGNIGPASIVCMGPRTCRVGATGTRAAHRPASAQSGGHRVGGLNSDGRADVYASATYRPVRASPMLGKVISIWGREPAYDPDRDPPFGMKTTDSNMPQPSIRLPRPSSPASPRTRPAGYRPSGVTHKRKLGPIASLKTVCPPRTGKNSIPRGGGASASPRSTASSHDGTPTFGVILIASG
jgi:hypothetical protein